MGKDSKLTHATLSHDKVYGGIINNADTLNTRYSIISYWSREVEIEHNIHNFGMQLVYYLTC